MVHHIEPGQIIDEVLKSEGLVVVDFFATWCAPCQMLAPVLIELDKKYGDEVEFYKVNIDESEDAAIRYGVSSVPTLIFFKDGEEIDRQVGFADEDELSNSIEEMK
mgnify:FL=1